MTSGEFVLCPTPTEDYTSALNPPYETLFTPYTKDDDVDSILSEKGLKSGKYSLKTDARAYLPFTRFSKMFDAYMKNDDQELECLDDARIGQLLKKMDAQPPVEEVSSNIPLDRVRANLFKTSNTFYYTSHIIF